MAYRTSPSAIDPNDKLFALAGDAAAMATLRRRQVWMFRAAGAIQVLTVIAFATGFLPWLVPGYLAAAMTGIALLTHLVLSSRIYLAIGQGWVFVQLASSCAMAGAQAAYIFAPRPLPVSSILAATTLMLASAALGMAASRMTRNLADEAARKAARIQDETADLMSTSLRMSAGKAHGDDLGP